MSRTSSDQRPLASALPSSEMPSGPGNISGKSVRTVAFQLLDMVIVFHVFRYRDLDAATGDVDQRHRLFGESQHDAVAIRPRDLNHVAGAEIVDGGDPAHQPRLAVKGFQPQQVGVIEFLA